MKCPCKECIKFPICYSNREVKCRDLYDYVNNPHDRFFFKSPQINQVLRLFNRTNVMDSSDKLGILIFTHFRRPG